MKCRRLTQLPGNSGGTKKAAARGFPVHFSVPDARDLSGVSGSSIPVQGTSIPCPMKTALFSWITLQRGGLFLSPLIHIVELRHEPQAGIDYAPIAVFSNCYPEYVRNGAAELLFKDLVREPVGPALERPDPFTPEPHALDIAGPARLDMVRQEFIKDPEFGELLMGDIEPARSVAFVKPLRHPGVCRVHGGRGKEVSCIQRSARVPGELFQPGGP